MMIPLELPFPALGFILWIVSTYLTSTDFYIYFKWCHHVHDLILSGVGLPTTMLHHFNHFILYNAWYCSGFVLKNVTIVLLRRRFWDLHFVVLFRFSDGGVVFFVKYKCTILHYFEVLFEVHVMKPLIHTLILRKWWFGGARFLLLQILAKRLFLQI